MINKLENYIAFLSFKGRRAKELARYRKRIYEFESMKADELDFEYITLKSKYESKKSVPVLLLFSAILIILINGWKGFFVFIEKALKFAASIENGNTEVIKVSLSISIVAILFVSSIILYILIVYVKELYRMQKELMIIDRVRDSH